MSFASMKNTLLNTTYLTASPKGGVGKTFAAASVITAFQLAGIKPLRIVEHDPVCPLRAVYGETHVESRAVGPEFQRQLQDPTAYLEHIGQLLEEIREPVVSRVIDLGAPMVEPFLKTAKLGRYGIKLPNRGRHIRIIIPTTTDRTDFDGASPTYYQAREIFPESPIAFVISERQGPASMLAGQKLIGDLNGDPLARIVVIPPCTSVLFATLYGNARLSPHDIMRMEAGKLDRVRNLNLLPSTRGIYLDWLQEWLVAVQAAYGDFLPRATAKAA